MTSDVLRLDADAFVALMLAVRTVGALLDEALGTKRTAFIAEGMGVDHAHVKLLPLHGIPDGPWSPVLADARTFSTTYAGYVTSLDGPRAADHELDAIQARIARVRDGSAG